MYDSVTSCNAVNDRSVLPSGWKSSHDIDSVYPEYVDNNWYRQQSMIIRIKEPLESIMFPIQLHKLSVMLLSPILAFCINVAIETKVFSLELLKGRRTLVHRSIGLVTRTLTTLEVWRYCFPFQKSSSKFLRINCLIISIASTYSKATNSVFFENCAARALRVLACQLYKNSL